MENQQAFAAAQRRINMIATHLQAASDDQEDYSRKPNLFSVNCSSTFNSGITRGDSRLYFARQGSSSQAFFKRQVSEEQDASPKPEVAVNLSPPAKGISVTALNRLMYSRPETLEKKYPSAGEVKPSAQNDSSFGPDHPKFAKPSSTLHEHDEIHVEKICNKKNIGNQWSPKMDIVETQSNYVVTVEVPGTGVGYIRVEVNNQSLVVTGKRANQCWKMSACLDESIPRYHTRGIQQGPYQSERPLPADANKDTVSAQFV